MIRYKNILMILKEKRIMQQIQKNKKEKEIWKEE